MPLIHRSNDCRRPSQDLPPVSVLTGACIDHRAYCALMLPGTVPQVHAPGTE
jgi:hypothetical protein